MLKNVDLKNKKPLIKKCNKNDVDKYPQILKANEKIL